MDKLSRQEGLRRQGWWPRRLPDQAVHAVNSLADRLRGRRLSELQSGTMKLGYGAERKSWTAALKERAERQSVQVQFCVGT